MPFNPQMMPQMGGQMPPQQGLGPNPQMLQRQMQMGPPMGNMQGGMNRPPMQPPMHGGMDQHAEQVGRALAQQGMAGPVMNIAQQMQGQQGPPQGGMGPSPQMQQQMMQRRQQMMQQQRPPMMGPQGQ